MHKRLFSLAAATLPLMGALGFGCPENPQAEMVFINHSGFDVQVVVDGERIGTLAAGETSPPEWFDCSMGQVFEISGSVEQNTDTFPSPFYMTFQDGVNFACGGTIQITYFLNNDDDLDLDGTAFD